MKKLLISFLIVLMSVSLFACGSSKSSEIADKQAYIEASDYILGFVNNGLDDASVEEYLNMKDEKLSFLLTNTDIQQSMLKTNAHDFKEILRSWKNARADFGEFVSRDDYTVAKTNQGIEVSCEAKFENRQAALTFTYDEDKYIKNLNVNGHYTGGEIAKKAGMNTLLGMGTVFIMLILISFVIYLFNYLPGGAKSKAKKKAAKADGGEPKENVQVIKPIVSAPVVNDNTEIVAAITAAISAYTGQSGDSFVVRSIKRKGRR